MSLHDHPFADRRAVPAHRLRRWLSTRHRRAPTSPGEHDHHRRAASSTATASRSTTRCRDLAGQRAGQVRHPEDTQDKPLESRASAASAGCLTDDDGVFRFTTIKPGRVPGPGGKLQAPHLVVIDLHARPPEAPATRASTFPTMPPTPQRPDAEARVPAERRATLIARPPSKRQARWNGTSCCRATDETVFFDF